MPLHLPLQYLLQNRRGFYLPELQKTYAELRPEEKNAISHRARALQAFCRIYREEFEYDDK